MSFQEPEEQFQESPETEAGGALDSAAINHFAMLHLDSSTAANHPNSAAAATEVPALRPLKRCTSCGSVKRRSPSSFKSLQEEPSPKRATLHPPSSTTIAPTATISTPPPPPPSSPSRAKQSTLYRSVSDMAGPLGAGLDIGNPSAFTAALSQFLSSQSPENLKNFNLASASASQSPAAASGSSLPPLPPVLYRSLSDPVPLDHHVVAAVATPPRLPTARTLLRSPSSDQESPNSKRLRRIKERVKEMSQWVEKVMSEEDEEESHSENNGRIINNCKDKAADETEQENEHQEAVWVEKKGDGLILHFKCPCSKGYEIFLSGNTCYYRLM